MRVCRIENANAVFGAPSDWIDDGSTCAGLPVRFVDTPQGRFLVSAWEPTPEEVEKLIDGETLKLWIRSPDGAHAVVSVTVGPIE